MLENLEHCQRILKSIAGIIGMENEVIRLSVANEAARLSGNVDTVWKQKAAENVARQFGIIKIANDILVDHPE